MNPREGRRLAQLTACLLLFLAVFFSKKTGQFPEAFERLASVLTSDANFAAAFTDFGWGLAAGRPVRETLGELFVDVFAPQSHMISASTLDGPLYLAAQERLTQGEPLTAPAVYTPFPVATFPAVQEEESIIPDTAEPTPTPTPTSVPTPVPSESVLSDAASLESAGPALPERVSMDKVNLNLDETTTPVLGAVTSDFGWRMHPLDGEEKFHYGVDLAASVGTPVRAFAAGVVEYIGESDDYGLYLQLDHRNGTKSFYAHCSALKVQQGQSVVSGETIAESGASGHVTGPHLHFELKKDGIRLSPLYYIENTP